LESAPRLLATWELSGPGEVGDQVFGIRKLNIEFPLGQRQDFLAKRGQHLVVPHPGAVHDRADPDRALGPGLRPSIGWLNRHEGK
jgi:hypothetical protein